MNFQRFYAGTIMPTCTVPRVRLVDKGFSFSKPLLDMFPDAVSVAYFWEADLRYIGFKFLDAREKGDYSLGKRATRVSSGGAFFNHYGLDKILQDFAPVFVDGGDIDFYIAIPEASAFAPPALSRKEAQQRVTPRRATATTPPAPAQTLPPAPRAPKWDKSYTLIQAIEVASLCVQGLGTAHAAERASVSLKQAHEIRNTWGTAEDVAELNERLERTR